MSLREREPRRYFVWLVVVVAHVGLIGAILVSRPRLSRESMDSGHSLTLLQLPRATARLDATAIVIRMDPAAFYPSIDADMPRPPIPLSNGAITLSPGEQQRGIDWDRESALAVQSSLAQAAKERNYRDLSSLTPEQLDWVKQNHMEPVPGFQWDRSSRGEMLRHGIFKLNDYCVLVVVIPFCRFGGKIQYNGDLFKDMREPKSPNQ